MPSRLEGIETIQLGLFRHQHLSACLHVPSRLEGIETARVAVLKFVIGYRLHVPSRLEGIETQRHRPQSLALPIAVYMCLPVWRELKPPYRHAAPSGSLSLHVPSRLEGIETIQSSPLSNRILSTCAFPFGGN